MTFVFLSFFFIYFVFEEKSAFLFQVSAGAMEERSGEDDDSNVQDEIINK